MWNGTDGVELDWTWIWRETVEKCSPRDLISYLDTTSLHVDTFWVCVIAVSGVVSHSQSRLWIHEGGDSCMNKWILMNHTASRQDDACTVVPTYQKAAHSHLLCNDSRRDTRHSCCFCSGKLQQKTTPNRHLGACRDFSFAT